MSIPAEPAGTNQDRAAIETIALSSARSKGAWARLLVVAAGGAGVDVFTKWIAFSRVASVPMSVNRHDVLAAGPRGIGGLIPPHNPAVAIPHVLEFRLVLNPGAVFGVGAGQRWFFVGFTAIAISLALWAFVKWTRPIDRWAHIGLGLVIAGGVGNLYDRLRFGCVRDFLHPLPGVSLPFGLVWPSGAPELWPWVSNVADALLLIGIGLLTLHMWKLDAAHRAAAKQELNAKPVQQES